jgi:TPR repeat protein
MREFLHRQAAADQGHSGAQYLLGLCYYYGEGVTKDHAEAKKWLSKSAAQGNKDAKVALKKFFGK